MEAMGRLITRMPRTAVFFLIGAAAISALPPLNGFASEWLVFQALRAGSTIPQPEGEDESGEQEEIDHHEQVAHHVERERDGEEGHEEGHRHRSIPGRPSAGWARAGR